MRHFLTWEQAALYAFIESLPSKDRPEVVVSCGGMWGIGSDVAIRRCKIGYLGIDIVPEYIEQGRQFLLLNKHLRSEHYYGFVEAPAESLVAVLARVGIDPAKTKILCYFPFNSFGSMVNPKEMLDVLVGIGCLFCISTYRTTPDAIKEWVAYHVNCGYTNVRTRITERGVYIVLGEGLTAAAYFPGYLQDLVRNSGIQLYTTPFSEIGNLIANSDVLYRDPSLINWLNSLKEE